MPGRARGLTGVVHGFCDCGVTVDAGATSTEACVAAIVEVLDQSVLD